MCLAYLLCSSYAAMEADGCQTAVVDLETCARSFCSGPGSNPATDGLSAIQQLRTLIILAAAIACDLVTVCAVLYALRRRRQSDEV